MSPTCVAEAKGTIRAARVMASAQSTDDYATPQNGQFYAVELALASTEGRFAVNYYDFQLQAPDYREFNADTFYHFNFPVLNQTTVPEGRSATVWLVFDVPVGTAFVLEYQSQGTTIASWHTSTSF